jgi:hypothetical protein
MTCNVEEQIRELETNMGVEINTRLSRMRHPNYYTKIRKKSFHKNTLSTAEKQCIAAREAAIHEIKEKYKHLIIDLFIDSI